MRDYAICWRSAAVLVAIAAAVGNVCPCANASQASSRSTRSFRMGFIPFPPDDTPEAIERVNRFIQANADIVGEQMESVPWTEALSGAPFQANLINNWRSRMEGVPAGAKIYLALNPGRGGLADYWGATEHDPMPAAFQGKTFSDAIVKRAYLAYCKRAIEYFKPSYVAIGIEVNEILYNAPNRAKDYIELHEYVYKELKKSYPNLPIFASFTLHGLLDDRHPKEDRERDLDLVKDLMPYDDVIAISYYPFFGNLSDRVDESLNWLASKFDRYGKPYAVAETGESAESLTVTVDGKPWKISGSPARQADYYRKLFAFADGHRTLFVINFLTIDYDALWKKIAGKSAPVFGAWQYCGLVDSRGNERPAYKVWKEYFDKPLHEKP